jgi:polyhydroxybutyrate depolymerase
MTRHRRIATALVLVTLFAIPGCRGATVTDARTPTGAIIRHGTVPMTQGDRTYRAYIPTSLSTTDPTPLILALHGSGGDADSFAPVTGFDGLAESARFVVVYPDGYEQSWNAGRCCGPAVTRGSGDVAFIAKLLDVFLADPKLHIDPRAIYVSGFSLGGMMTYRLGCELSERIAAIGLVSGVLAYETCQPTRAVPLLHIHGTSDHVVPYEGQSPPDGLASAPASVAKWRTLCPGVDVQLLTIDGGGHVWPRDIGHSPSLSGIRAADSFWQFFASHRM